MVSKKLIEEFVGMQSIAVAGVSNSKKRFGYVVYSELKKRGFNVFPVNPKYELIDEDKCYPYLKSLPQDIKALLILTSKKNSEKIVQEAIGLGFTHIWFQQGSETQSGIELALNNNIKTITKNCILMFAGKVAGFHKFHLQLRRIFGAMPS